MYNIPITHKLSRCVSESQTEIAERYFRKYDFFVYQNNLLARATPVRTQIDLYELMIAAYVSSKFEAQHFIEIVKVNSKKRRCIAFAGNDALQAQEAFNQVSQQLHELYLKRYYAYKSFVRGSAAAAAYRVGVMESTLDRTPRSVKSPDFYKDLLKKVRLTGSLVRGNRRDLRSDKAWGAGLDDGLVNDFVV